MKNYATKFMLSVILLMGIIFNVSIAETFNLELLSWVKFGDCEAIAVEGDYLYAANYGMLQTWDLSGETAELVNEQEWKAEIEDLVVENGKLYAKWECEAPQAEYNVGGGFAIFDLTDPTTPELVYDETLEFGAGGIAVNDDTFYITTDSCWTYIYDVANLAAVTKTSELAYPDSIDMYKISINNGNAFLLGAADGILVFDLSNNTQISAIPDVNARAIDFEGDYGYVGTYSGFLHTLDISDPTNVTVIDTLELASNSKSSRRYIFDVKCSNGSVYVAEGYDYYFHKVVFGDHTADPVVTKIELEHQGYDIQVVGDVIYVAAEESGCAVVDTEFANSPVYIETAFESDKLRICERTKRAFVISDDFSSLRIVDFKDATNMKSVFFSSFGENYCEGVVAHPTEDYLYVSLDTVIQIYGMPEEINALQQPTVVHTINDTSLPDPEKMTIDGKYLYVVEDDNANIHVYDITDPLAPVFHHKFNYGDYSGYEYDIEVAEGVCVMASYKDGYNVWDVSDIDNKNVEHKFSKSCYKTYSVDINNGNIFAANYGKSSSKEPEGIRVNNFSYGWEYAHITVDSAFGGDSFYGVSATDDYVYGANDDDGFKMYAFDDSFAEGSEMGTNVLGNFDSPGDVMECEATSDGSLIIVAVGDAGLMAIHNTMLPLVKIDEENKGVIAEDFRLEQNYPNPFNPTTTISYSIPQKMDVEISIYDMMGRKISTLVNNQMNAGYHQVKWDASTNASGVYFYQIKVGEMTKTRKCLLVK